MPAMIDPQTQEFFDKTRLIYPIYPTISKQSSAGGVQSIQLPRTGLLQGIRLNISGTLTSGGGISAPNAKGKASIIRRVRVFANSSNDIFSVSGAGYSYLLTEMLGHETVMTPGLLGVNNGRDAVATGAFRLDMYIPIAMNVENSIGLFMLQNNQTTVELQIEFAPDSEVATGIDSLTCTVQPRGHVFKIPDDNTLPMLGLSYVHQIVEDSRGMVVGDYDYEPTKGDIYLQIGHALTIAQANNNEDFNRFRQIIQQSDVWMDEVPDSLDTLNALQRGRARLKGNCIIDFMGSSGFGDFSIERDWYDTQWATDFVHRFNVADSPFTLTALRRQLIRKAGS